MRTTVQTMAAVLALALAASALAAGERAEMSIPFNALSVSIGKPVEFYVELIEGNQSRDRAPLEGVISLQRPSADFERLMWDV